MEQKVRRDSSSSAIVVVSTLEFISSSASNLFSLRGTGQPCRKRKRRARGRPRTRTSSKKNPARATWFSLWARSNPSQTVRTTSEVEVARGQRVLPVVVPPQVKFPWRQKLLWLLQQNLTLKSKSHPKRRLRTVRVPAPAASTLKGMRMASR